jgi:hypothetical protein
MVPYYIIMRLPGETQAAFFLMLPIVPSRRENMIAWLAARCHPPGYGKLIVYEFPKKKLVYGPFQIEALINQNTYISQQLSLWNQLGSRVIRGNLLVIPIENSILYVSPLYLRAEKGQLPELKRVIPRHLRRGDRKQRSAEAVAARMHLCVRTDGVHRQERCFDAEMTVVVHAEIALICLGISPRDHEDGEAVGYEMAYQGIRR